jgi:flagellar biosynthesis chaperone FliJ
MNSQINASASELKQLSRLRQLRVNAALELQNKCVNQLNVTLERVETRLVRIATIKSSISDLANYMVGPGSRRLPKEGTYATAQRERLDDQLERNEYALLGEQEAVEEAEQQLQNAKQAWIKAVAREEAVKKMQTKFQHQILAIEHKRSELVNEERVVLHSNMNTQSFSKRAI